MINTQQAIPSTITPPIQRYPSNHPICGQNTFPAAPQNQQQSLQQQTLNLLLPLIFQLINQLSNEQNPSSQNQPPHHQATQNQPGDCTCPAQERPGSFSDLLTDVRQAKSDGLTQAADVARSKGFTDTAQFLDDAALGAKHSNPLETQHSTSSFGFASPEATFEGFTQPSQGFSALLDDVQQAQQENIQITAELESVFGKPLQDSYIQELSRDATRGRLIRNNQNITTPPTFFPPLPEGLSLAQQTGIIAQQAEAQQAARHNAANLTPEQHILMTLAATVAQQFLQQISVQSF